MPRDVPEPVDTGALRVSDAEREQVQQMLARAMVAGRLTAGEYSDRAATALAARVRRDLDGLLDDLPGAALHTTLDADVLELEAGVGGSITRRGWWRVPPLVRVRSWVGGVVLDFADAEFVAPVVAIELATGMCSPVLVLPAAATVDVDDLRVSAGRVRDETANHRERGTPHIAVRGRHSFGEVHVRHPRKPRWRPGKGGPTRPTRLGRVRAPRAVDTTPDPRHAES